MLELATNLPQEVFEAIGVVGFCVYVLAYTLLTIGKLHSGHLTYFALNWIAATCVLIGLFHSFNLASALIQVFWIGVSTIAIVIRLRRAGVGTPTPV